jgi:predicted  nucleic acid-binding Zn-ribbon protein
LDIDEKFLETTTDSCKAKAGEWAERSRLRTEEVAGINQAVDILTSDDAKGAFNTADTTFVQTRAVQNDPQKTEAYNILKKVASKSDNARLATLASKMYTSTGWHFDSVIADIEKMIVKLREEEQDDIEHRDWCQSERSNANSQNEALEYDMEQLQNKINRANKESENLDKEKTATLAEISDLTSDMDDAKTLRNNENKAFQTAMKADMDSVMLIGQAIEALSKFFEKNSLLSKHFTVKKVKQPEYTENEDTAPETFSGSYGGRSSENTGIVAILGMIKEDMEKEMKVARKEETAADAAYRKLLKESTDSNNTMTKKVNDLDNVMAELAKKVSDLGSVKGDKSEANVATDKYLADMKANCDWIEDKFTTRQSQRKDEIKGLEQAKAALAGAKSASASGFVAKSKVVAKGPSVEDELKELDNTEKSFGLSFLQRRLA